LSSPGLPDASWFIFSGRGMDLPPSSSQ
jgi:hypothetical protein